MSGVTKVQQSRKRLMNEQERSKKQEGSGRSGKGEGRRMENKPEGESSTVKRKDSGKPHLVLTEGQ